MRRVEEFGGCSKRLDAKRGLLEVWLIVLSRIDGCQGDVRLVEKCRGLLWLEACRGDSRWFEAS